MKTITIRELHNRTGELVREASRQGEIRVTDNGRVVARIVPQAEPPPSPILPAANLLRPSKSWMRPGRPVGALIAASPSPRIGRIGSDALLTPTTPAS
ncbi:MAG: type II toxin-antitoxin system Phd/YefM family antitoxin [Limisphaerales bacterium]